MHERGQADAAVQHVGGEGVPEAVRVGYLDRSGLAMIAE
jgi:hypothetical protein